MQEQDLQQKLVRQYQAMGIIEDHALKTSVIEAVSKIIGFELTQHDALKRLFCDLESLYGTEIAEDKKNTLEHFYTETAMDLIGRNTSLPRTPYGHLTGVVANPLHILNPFNILREKTETWKAALEFQNKTKPMLLYIIGRIALDLLDAPDTEITEDLFQRLFKIYERSWNDLGATKKMLNDMVADAECVDSVVQALESMYETKLNEATQPLRDMVKESMTRQKPESLMDKLKKLRKRMDEEQQKQFNAILTAYGDVLRFHLETKQQADAETLTHIMTNYAVPRAEREIIKDL